MCNIGGGTNRCIRHNPVSKFVVKVVTVKTKADDGLVSKTLVELNKEGKALPAPQKETVKAWIDTEKFSTQYDPELSEHERRIQLNRLERAEVDNVSGSNFHAWKNLHSAVRTKMAQRIAAAGMIVGMSASLVGCFASDGRTTSDPTHEMVPPSPPISNSQSYIQGSGEKVETEDGSYEKVIIAEDAPALEYNMGMPHPQYLTDAGFTEQDGREGQQLAVNYLVQEFVDSEALETGDAGYKEWLSSSTPNQYFGSEVLNDPTIASNGSSILLGNFGGQKVIPKLIHDGTPRERSLDLTPVGIGTWENDNGETIGISYTFDYKTEYRVDDNSAVEFLAQQAGTSKEDYQKTKASDNLKDGKGENVYTASGQIGLVIARQADGTMKIIGFQADSQLDSSTLLK